MDIGDPASTYAALRTETATLLKLDPDSAGLVENLQIDLVALLRLEVDGLSGAALAGQQVDLRRLEVALGMLRQMLPAQALIAPTPVPESRFGPSARERLRELIETTVLAEDVAEAERMRDVREREEMAASIAAGIPHRLSKHHLRHRRLSRLDPTTMSCRSTPREPKNAPGMNALGVRIFTVAAAEC